MDARNYLEGLTALHLAAIFGRTEAAHALLEHGAGTAIRDRDGHTAAKLATLFGQAAFVAALIPLPIAEVSTVNALHLFNWAFHRALE